MFPRILVFATIAGLTATLGAQQRTGTPQWVTAWTTSQQTLGATTLSNATVRMIARVTAPGEAIRIRLDNTFGTAAVKIGSAFVGERVQSALLAAGSNHAVMFNGQASTMLQPGGSVVSDAVTMPVRAWQDLAVSLFVPELSVRPSQHSGAVVTSYLSADGSGDVAATEARTPFVTTTTSTFWLKGIDVLAPAGTTGIVAFGDSITDGTCTTLDAHDRWEDWLSIRLQAQTAATGQLPRSVVNEGIGGNTVSGEGLQPPPDSPPAVERLERDVLSHTGVTDVIVFIGTNDIRRGASAAQVIGGLSDVAKRLKTKGKRVIAATIIPRHNVPPSGTNTGWDAGKTAIRNEVNQWIRAGAAFDAILDFDKVVRSGADPNLMTWPYNCGDGIHPSPFGYYEMGKAIPLDLFSRPN